MPLSSAEIIKNAWKKTGLTQAKFAEAYEVTQYNLSKYINSKVTPPEKLLMHCMHILGMMNESDVTPDELTDLIKTRLSRPDQAAIRRAVYDLLRNVS